MEMGNPAKKTKPQTSNRYLILTTVYNICFSQTQVLESQDELSISVFPISLTPGNSANKRSCEQAFIAETRDSWERHLEYRM